MKAAYNFYDRFVESPLMGMPTPVRWGALGALNAGSTMAYNAMPWVTEEEKSNPLISAALNTPAEVLALEYTQGLKDKYNAPLAEAMKLDEQRVEGGLNKKWNPKYGGTAPKWRDASEFIKDLVVSKYGAPLKRIYTNSGLPVRAAYTGSLAAGIGQIPILAYNALSPAKVNVDVATAGAFGLGALVPITMALMKSRGKA